MRAWLGTILLAITGTFAAASGCGNPEVINKQTTDTSDSGTTDASSSGGTGFVLGDGGDGITCPSTCDMLNANCGFVTDKACNGVIQCGACPDGQVCGGGGANRCGTGIGLNDGGQVCTPSTCAQLNADCGFVTDTNCTGTVSCGTCPDGQQCGLGGPNLCGVGDGGTCVVDPATTCDGRGYTCGQAADNCGNSLDCGPATCADPNQTCLQGVCTTPACIVDPTTTCAGQGYTCGQVADNCGHRLTCGPTCSLPGFTCGGGTDATSGKKVPGVCGCTGACSTIPDCSTSGPNPTTTLSGTVYDPAGNNPLYHVLVYIANNPTDPDLLTFPPGISCEVCGASAAGSPLISDPTVTDPPAGTYTDTDGTFTLKNVPVGQNLTLVIQLGRWRRVFSDVNVATPCAPNTVPDKKLLMPSKQSEGNIPLMAMMTGEADSLECVLRKMGIADSEFTNPADNGRVQFYLGGGKDNMNNVVGSGQAIDANTPGQDALFTTVNNQPLLNSYDMAILACQGAGYTETAGQQAALRNYADSGGRVFATHYSYTWLYQNNENAANVGTADNWGEVAKWHVDEGDRLDTATGYIDTVSNPKGNAFQKWLEAVGASTKGSGTADVIVIRHDTDFISTTPGQTQQWLWRKGDDPASRKCSITATACGKDADCTAKVCAATQATCNVAGDCDAKVCKGTTTACTKSSNCAMGVNCVSNACTANTCTGTDYTGEETPLHFTFNTPVNLDLVTKPTAVQCGRVLFSDFHVQDAHEHGVTFPAQCGAACTKDSDCAGKCVDKVCLDPMNAQEKLLEFMIFDLGSCVPPPVTCKPATACPAGQDCGYASDGCGALIPCGTCPDGEQCGVGQPPIPNKCGSITCNPTACPADQECGFASNGCSGVVNCGTCPKGQTCSGGKCGSQACSPQSCVMQNIECGEAGDQCGNQLQCPMCPTGDSCIKGKCVPQSCVPQSCSDQMVECGPAADGCGQMITSCGMCSAGDLCVQGTCTQVK